MALVVDRSQGRLRRHALTMAAGPHIRRRIDSLLEERRTFSLGLSRAGWAAVMLCGIPLVWSARSGAVGSRGAGGDATGARAGVERCSGGVDPEPRAWQRNQPPSRWMRAARCQQRTPQTAPAQASPQFRGGLDQGESACQGGARRRARRRPRRFAPSPLRLELRANCWRISFRRLRSATPAEHSAPCSRFPSRAARPGCFDVT